jgi:hypothetical protein
MDGMDLGGDFSYWGMSSASSKACAGAASHAPEMKPEQKQAVTPQREIAPQQAQGEDFGLGL